MAETIGDIFANLFSSKEVNFKRSVKKLKKKVPKGSRAGIVLNLLGRSKNKDEARVDLMLELLQMTCGLLTQIPFKKNPGGFDPFTIDPDEALLGDTTTDMSRLFDPGVKEFISPERAEKKDPRAMDSRDIMRILDEQLRRRFFDQLYQREQRKL